VSYRFILIFGKSIEKSKTLGILGILGKKLARGIPLGSGGGRQKNINALNNIKKKVYRMYN
jgi:hypothetical protein